MKPSCWHFASYLWPRRCERIHFYCLQSCVHDHSRFKHSRFKKISWVTFGHEVALEAFAGGIIPEDTFENKKEAQKWQSWMYPSSNPTVPDVAIHVVQEDSREDGCPGAPASLQVYLEYAEGRDSQSLAISPGTREPGWAQDQGSLDLLRPIM